MRDITSHNIQEAAYRTWDSDAALTNIERWLEICKREELGDCPENIDLLICLFGASWYFTRLVFYLGKDIIDAFDHADEFNFSSDVMKEQLLESGG